MGIKKYSEGSFIAYIGNLVKQYGGLNLAQGIPGFQPPAELIEILVQISKTDVHQYPHSVGNLKLLYGLVNYYNQYNKLSSENFLVVQGATEGISLLYTYLITILDKPKVLVFDPPYESFTNLPKIFRHPVFSVPVPYETGLDIDLIKQIIEKEKINIVFICSPGNPYGKSFSKNEVTEIVKIAEKNNCYIIFDHVYKEIYFNEESYIPLINFSPFLLYVNSFSKSLSITGWRIGYIIAQKQHIDKIKPLHDYIGLCAPSLLQEAIAVYNEKYDFGKQYVATIRKKISANYNFMKKELIQLGFEIAKTDGGYFIWAKLPEKMNECVKFTLGLFEKEKVAVIPGVHFLKNATDFIRINIGLEEEKMKEGIRGIKKYLNAV